MGKKLQIRCCAAVLAAVLLMGTGSVLHAYAAQLAAQDSGMALDTSELTLEMTSEDPAPAAYLSVQALNDYFFLIWSSSAPSVASVDGTGKVTGHA